MRFDIVVSIEVYDGEELELVNSKVVRGDGIYRMERIVGSGSNDPYSPTNMGLNKRKNRLEKAIKEAIQDVSSEVVKLLRSDFPESNN